MLGLINELSTIALSVVSTHVLLLEGVVSNSRENELLNKMVVASLGMWVVVVQSGYAGYFHTCGHVRTVIFNEINIQNQHRD